MMNTMHLFAGGGGGLLCDLILGHNPIVAVEWEPYACQILRERAADGLFPNLHVWEGDVRLFNPSDYTGKVGCVHAGFPCTDISVAGKQAGIGEGTRSGLYREVLRIADVVRPQNIFLENVSAIISMGGNGIGQVIADLSALGYDAKWLTLRASDVGAPHHRDRWWCLCTRRAELSPHAEHCWARRREQRQEGVTETHRVPYATSAGLEGEQRTELEGDGDGFTNNGENVADTNSAQREGNERTKRSEQEYSNVGGGSGREIITKLGSVADGLADRLDADQPLQGWWEVEPQIGRVATDCKNRAAQLKALGNGQVPLQTAVAWRLLGGY